MFKRIALFGLFYGILDIMLVSCCPDSPLDYTKFNTAVVSNVGLSGTLPDSSEIRREDYRIVLQLNGEFVAANYAFPGFSGNSYAFSCQNQGLDGLKSDIIRFEITCNRPVLGMLAGEKLDLNKLRAYENGFYDDSKNVRLTVAEWLSYLNNGRRQQAHYQLYFEFQEPVISPDYLRLNSPSVLMTEGF